MNNQTILEYIDDPSDLKLLSCEELSIVASEIREKIISTTSKTGGHVASSLGAVEIILAVHSLINSPKDKFIFDVGHQAYAHKLVTPRNKQFDTLREYNGLSGFIKPKESNHDIHYSGHASDSLSIASGIAKANKINKENNKIITLIGDASIVGGMSFEAINQIGYEKLPIVIILNDNNMSISPSVGGFVDHLSTIRLNTKYKNARSVVHYNLKRFGSAGDIAIKWAQASKNSFKHLLFPNHILFEELGITCMPTVDGHDIPSLRNCLRKAFDVKGPVLIHALTHKGAGYKPAYENPESFHSIGPYDIKTGKSIANKEACFTSVFSNTVCNIAKKDNKIVALTAAMSSGTGLKNFQKMFEDRFIDTGIAEEHLVTSAAGMAKQGLKPIVAIYSTFLQRAFDQMITNVAIENLNVIFCVDRAGIVGRDGMTHHGLFDIAYGRMIPNFTVITPSCASELVGALNTAIEGTGPFLIRYPRGKASEIDEYGNISEYKYKLNNNKFKIGSSRTLIDGDNATIMCFGDCVEDSITASKLLKKENINARVIDMRFAKPLDKEAIIKAVEETKNIITVEDGILSGGAGDGVLQLINTYYNNKDYNLKSLGINDKFVTHGNISQLKASVNIDSHSIYETVKYLVTK